ncbi:unnamed protein product [Lactuca virosa]|uniref:FPL domain-containing protein n=1 Tax=Lactuca virosa TaxID=75947 RepID=A0AAU9MLK2_9ASTR|nr:unnamed protein product [Lactuca virosa]
MRNGDNGNEWWRVEDRGDGCVYGFGCLLMVTKAAICRSGGPRERTISICHISNDFLFSRQPTVSLQGEDDFYIRYYTLQLLTALLTNSPIRSYEIQKILVFEGAFEKIFSIIKEEGGSEGSVVVQALKDATWCFLIAPSNQKRLICPHTS